MAQGIVNRAPLLLAALLAAGGAAGEQVYRCETEDGLIFQDLPCEGPGEVVEVPTDPPDPQEVERMRRQHAEMRALIEAAERRRLSDQAEAKAPVPAVIPPQPRHKKEDDDHQVRILDACPLGLGNCPKPDPPVFRRHKPDRHTPADPLGGDSTEEHPPEAID